MERAYSEIDDKFLKGFLEPQLRAMVWWLLRLMIKILAILRLTVDFFRLGKILRLAFFTANV